VLKITVGDLIFVARFEGDAAPNTVAGIRKLLPVASKLILAPWCGEAGKVDMSKSGFEMGGYTEHETFENHTHHPAPGELLMYPGGYSVLEILFALGPAIFASRLGYLTGNHFATLEHGRENMAELGRRLIWEGAQEVMFEEA
jgi:Protein of unknown function (DUF3830)